MAFSFSDVIEIAIGNDRKESHRVDKDKMYRRMMSISAEILTKTFDPDQYQSANPNNAEVSKKF
jgi:hypothetical protein